MIDLLILFIKISCVSLFITGFEPFQNLKTVIGRTRVGKNLLFQLFDKITGCSKCLSFWLSIVVLSMEHYQPMEIFIYSTIVSLLTMFFYKLTNIYYSK